MTSILLEVAFNLVNCDVGGNPQELCSFRVWEPCAWVTPYKNNKYIFFKTKKKYIQITDYIIVSYKQLEELKINK